MVGIYFIIKQQITTAEIFNQLTFDNIGGPSSINETYNSINGLNTQLQRNLDFNNGFSSLISQSSALTLFGIKEDRVDYKI